MSTGRISDLPDATLPLKREEPNPDVLRVLQYDGSAYRDRQFKYNLITINESLNAFAAALYGGMEQNALDVPFTDIGLGWTTINTYDTINPVTPKGVNVSLANGSLTPTVEGVFVISVYLAISHNESNQGRQTFVRLHNLTDGTSSPGTAIFIGRNQPGLNFAYTSLIEVTATSVNDELVIQIGGGSSLTSVEIDAATYDLYSVGEFRGTFSNDDPTFQSLMVREQAFESEGIRATPTINNP